MKHTILGAGGSIGNALAYELLKAKEPVRLVSRSMYAIPGTESYKADLTSYQETLDSVKNSDIVYLCAGLQYNVKVWADLWPKIMKNTIEACKQANAKLIFFDNVYMLGRVEGKMTESSPYNPCSKKGEIRAKLDRMLEAEMKDKNLNAIIARAADLYGPYANRTSMLYILVFDKMMHGKKPQWMANPKTHHSFTYTVDCAKALLMLAKNDESFGQIWHLPTFNPAPNGEEFISITAKELDMGSGYSVLKKWMVRVGGLFDKTISELYEMMYQYEFDYYFDSTKFNAYFTYQPVSYTQGIHDTIDLIRKQ